MENRNGSQSSWCSVHCSLLHFLYLPPLSNFYLFPVFYLDFSPFLIIPSPYAVSKKEGRKRSLASLRTRLLFRDFSALLGCCITTWFVMPELARLKLAEDCLHESQLL